MKKKFSILIGIFAFALISTNSSAVEVFSANGFNCKGFDDGRILCTGAFSFSPDVILSTAGKEFIAILAEYKGVTHSYSSQTGCLCETSKDPKTQGDIINCKSKKGKTKTFKPQDKLDSYQAWCEKN